MPSNPNSRSRVTIAFLCLFVVLIAGGYFVWDLGKLQESIAARDRQTALQDLTDPAQIEEALRQHPSNRFLQLIAMAAKSANETDAAFEKLTHEIEPPAISKSGNLGGASRSALEALRRDLKTAETNATTFLPRSPALLKPDPDSS